MKNSAYSAFLHLILAFLSLTSLGFSKKRIKPKSLQLPCIVTLNGNECVGSLLTLTSSSPVKSIKWMLNGVSVLSQSIDKQNNGQIVAGGNGNGNAMNQLYNPSRVFVDKEGNLYIPDMTNNRIQKWAVGATVGVTIAGGNGIGNGANQFNRPTGVTVDNLGNIYIADQNNGRIQKWTSGSTTGVTIASGLGLPTDVCFDPAGNLYVSEQSGTTCVRKYTNATGVGTVVAGGNGYGSSSNQLAAPTGIYVDANNNLYICDTDNSRVQKWAFGASSGVTVARLPGNPLGVYVDGNNNIFVTDYTGYNVLKVLPSSVYGTIIAGGNGQGNSPNQITPIGIGMDKYNNLYVSDFFNSRVVKFSNIYTGTYTALTKGIYTAEVTTTDGCIGISNSIEIKENITPQISISSTTLITCDKFPPKFTANILNGGSSPKIQWKINGANATADGNSASFMPQTTKVGDLVSCELTSTENCINNSVFQSNALRLIGSSDIPSISINSDVASICKGTPVRFTSSATNAGQNPIYTWKVNGMQVATGLSNVFITNTLNNNDVVRCYILSDAQICQATDEAESNLVKINVNPILTPSITINSTEPKIYPNYPTTFISSTQNEGTNARYNWLVNGISTDKNGNKFTTSSLKDGDEITCVLTVKTPCASSSFVTSNTITVTLTKITKITPNNAFSPNGDNINDTWVIDELKLYPLAKVRIYNRMGTEVFQSIGYKNPWNGEGKYGTICPSGVYFYLIKLNDKETISGSVALLK